MEETSLNWRNYHPACEVCDNAPAIDMQGGVVDGERKLWFCCRECKKRIKDERKIERRNNGQVGIPNT